MNHGVSCFLVCAFVGFTDTWSGPCILVYLAHCCLLLRHDPHDHSSAAVVQQLSFHIYSTLLGDTKVNVTFGNWKSAGYWWDDLDMAGQGKLSSIVNTTPWSKLIVCFDVLLFKTSTNSPYLWISVSSRCSWFHGERLHGRGLLLMSGTSVNRF